MVSRKEVQDQINNLVRIYPNNDRAFLVEQISQWLDNQDLTYEGMDQNFIKTRILDDLNSYEGIPS